MRKVKINKKNHLRAILTDTLPYEIPLFHTNELVFKELTSNPDLTGLPTFVANLLLHNADTKPFTYRVQKGGGSHRSLAIPHPAAQIKFAELYRDFDSFIENVCSRSPYSLRHPTRVGSHFFQSQYREQEGTDSGVDQDPSSFDRQRTWASSYFYYKKYSHIHKFFSSSEFFKLEQNFTFMLKLDISRCFESIYTHSIAWAVRGKEFGKDNKSSFFFEAEFDKRMQRSNWGETSGILIGPEVSRIFAESIMQSVDTEVYRQIEKLSARVEVRRYVDDFFVFGNSHEDLMQVKAAIETSAARYNLHLNEKKTETSHRPFTSNMAVARQRVAQTLTSAFRSARHALTGQGDRPHFSRRAGDQTVAEIRRIARENDVDYATLASPALAVITKEVHQIRRRIGDSLPDGTAEVLDRINHTALRISSFLFLMDIRSTTSHKIAKIFLECSIINAKAGLGRSAFEGQILDIVRTSLDQATKRCITGPEVINVLIAADAVCNSVKGIAEDNLKSAFGKTGKWADICLTLNYFELISILYLGRKSRSFDSSLNAARNEIKRRLVTVGTSLKIHTEETMLFFDFLSCPHIEKAERLALYEEVSVLHGSKATKATMAQQFAKISRSVRFVAWEGQSHFQAMLQRRELQPAYDS